MPAGLRIAFLENSPLLGGGQLNLLALLGRLDRSRFESSVICHQEGPFTEQFKAWDVSLTLFDMGRLRQRFFWGFAPRRRRLAAWFKEKGIQLMVANSFPAAKLGILAARDAGIPSILFKQIIIHKSRFSSTAAIYRYYLGRCNRILAVSEACRNGLLNIGIPKRKIKVVPNGVDIERWKPGYDGLSFRKKYGIGENVHLVGCVAALRLEKGIETLLKAWSDVVKYQPQAVLAVIGDVEPLQEAYGDELRSLSASLGLSRSVIFCGYQMDLRPAFGALDLFVASSHSEAFGLSLATAMACGKAVISTRSGGPEEIIEDGESGYLVPIRGSKALAEALLSLLADPTKREKIGQAARRRIGEKFSLEKQVEALEQFFQEVASSG